MNFLLYRKSFGNRVILNEPLYPCVAVLIAVLSIRAQWVHGQKGNVVFEIAESAHELNTNIQTLESSGFAENVVFGFEDYKLNKEQVQQFMQTVDSLEEISKSELSGWNKSLGEYFEEK